jgi:hypothetical protein
MELEIGQTLTDKKGNNFTVTAICPYMCEKQREGNKPCVMSGRFHYRNQNDKWCFTSTRNRPLFTFCKKILYLRQYEIAVEEAIAKRHPLPMEVRGMEPEIGQIVTDIDGNMFIVIAICPYKDSTVERSGDPESEEYTITVRSNCVAFSTCILSDKGFCFENPYESGFDILDSKGEYPWRLSRSCRSFYNCVKAGLSDEIRKEEERRKEEIIRMTVEELERKKGGING